MNGVISHLLSYYKNLEYLRSFAVGLMALSISFFINWRYFEKKLSRKEFSNGWKFLPFPGKCPNPLYFGKALSPNYSVKIKLLGIIWKTMNIFFTWYLRIWCMSTVLPTIRSKKSGNVDYWASYKWCVHISVMQTNS